jgi:hypothetical protein
MNVRERQKAFQWWKNRTQFVKMIKALAGNNFYDIIYGICCLPGWPQPGKFAPEP